MSLRKILVISLATTSIAVMVNFVPTRASAQVWTPLDILVLPLAVAAAPFVAAADLLGAPGYYGPGPIYAYADAPVFVSDADWIAYCSAKYRSFDPVSGTYLGYDGVRHYCR